MFVLTTVLFNLKKGIRILIMKRFIPDKENHPMGVYVGSQQEQQEVKVDLLQVFL